MEVEKFACGWGLPATAQLGEGQALGNLGIALREVRRFEEAVDAHTQAVAAFRELGDRHSEGQALNNLGAVLQGVGRFEEAFDAHTRAAAAFRELGDPNHESQPLTAWAIARNERWLRRS
ncbi:tetratricopeptide repeat protein [Streptomyces mirabilis]|uniref:tetratricopeptide repeat protein n=1 Tax=Streptomyces mirabilis TaxID=68239 RepID=UPI0009437FB4|nr:tetratricopeptide repeat protein [Streptomyces mirabilis]